MKNNFGSFQYASKVKDILLELPDYKYSGDAEQTINNNKFIGRTKHINKLLGYLQKGGESGSYLITGYRGMGKTTYVNKTLHEYFNQLPKSEKKTTIRININLGQKNLSELDVLRQIINQTRKSILPRYIHLINKYIIKLKAIPVIAILISVIFYLISEDFNFSLNNLFTKESSYLLTILFFSFLIAALFVVTALSIIRIIGTRVNYFNRLTLLYERCISNVRIEGDDTMSFNKFNLSFGSKRSKSYPIANPKEVENELLEVLEKLIHHKSPKKKRVFIYVFDEVDKIFLEDSEKNLYEDMSSFEKNGPDRIINYSRERKHSVVKLLGSLKYLLTTAKARFIFIAGREMFDAALADVSDRNSSISSIFTHVIYLDSFLKDSITKEYLTESNLSYNEIIEEYLSKLLLPASWTNNSNSKPRTFLSDYYKYLNNLKIDNSQNQNIEEAIYKIIVTIQNMIVYLTYRSNGSPKKLIKLLEENFINIFENANIKSDFKNNSSVIIREHKHQKHKVNKTFLKIDTNLQYRFNFIAYLYRPFIIANSRAFKKYSDRLLVSTTYLMDHIIKYHPFAFSLQNLEAVPEILSDNKTPELREFIEYLVSYLSHNHIRNAESGIFEYKFYNKTHLEISYLSKMFEDESAAFNFSLDESFNIKIFIRTKIKELRSIFKDFKPGFGNDGPTFSSICFLNDTLGDISFFDQEYDDAVISYSDAIMALGEKAHLDNSVTYYSTYCRIKLKLGLTYEKMKSYELAYGVYLDLLIFIENIINEYNTNINLNSAIYNEFLKDIANNYSRVTLSLCYLSEKRDSNNTTTILQSTINNTLNKISDIYIPIQEIPRYILILNFANLLYYKNEQEFVETPEFIQSDLLYKFVSNKTEAQDRRVPIAAFNYYLQAINEIYNSKFVISTNDNPNETLLFKICALAETIKTSSNSLDRDIILRYAGALSNITNILFSAYAETRNNSTKDTLLKPFTSFLHLEDLHLSNYKTISSVILGDISNSQTLFHLIISSYYTAGKCYLWAGRSVSYGFQLRKMLHVYRLCTGYNISHVDYKVISKEILAECLDVISWNSISTDRPQLEKYKNYFDLNSKYFQDIKTSKSLFSFTSPNPEVREIVLFYQYIALKELKSQLIKLNKRRSFELIVKVTNYNNFASQNKLIGSMFIQTHEYHLQVILNGFFFEHCNDAIPTYINNEWLYGTNSFDSWALSDFEATDKHWTSGVNDMHHLFESIKYELARRINYNFNHYNNLNDFVISELSDAVIKNKSPETYEIFHNKIYELISINKMIAIEYEKYLSIVLNSIYCISEIINIYHASGTSYLMNNSALGDYHRRLGLWLKKLEFFKMIYERFYGFIDKNYYQDMLKGLKPTKNINLNPILRLSKMINPDYAISLKPISQYHLAVRHYYLAIQMHQVGSNYRGLVINSYYLEDDFNDNLFHFNCSLERHKINTGKLRNRIQEVKINELKNTPLKQIKYYM